MAKARSLAASLAGPKRPMTEVIASDGAALSEELQAMRTALFPPVAQKALRSFSSVESAKLIGIADAYLRQLSLNGKGPQPAVTPGGRRS